MATLAETQIKFRRTLIIIVIISVLFYTGRGIYRQGVKFYAFLFPEKESPPEAKYGKLPQLKMTSVKFAGNPEYIIDTSNGQLPSMPGRTKVYSVPAAAATLLGEQTVKDLANEFAFDENFTKKSASEFKWIDGVNERTFTADAASLNFQLNTAVDKLTTVVNLSFTLNKSDAANTVSNFIKSKNLLNATDQNTMRVETYPTMISLGRIRESKIDTERARMIKVDVYRDLIAVPADDKKKTAEVKYKILSYNPKSSLISFFNVNNPTQANTGKSGLRYPVINFTYWPVNYNDSSEYPLSSLDSIWNIVTQNKGVISYLKLEEDDYFDSFKQDLRLNRIEIKNIYLAYYESKDYQGYLQPIYVFEGKFQTTADTVNNVLSKSGDIVIYYPAIRGDYVNAP